MNNLHNTNENTVFLPGVAVVDSRLFKTYSVRAFPLFCSLICFLMFCILLKFMELFWQGFWVVVGVF